MHCSQNHFNCSIGNLQCIPWLWVCDGDEDCTDGSDEATALCGLLFINICITIYLHQLWLWIAGDWECHKGGFKCTTGNITCINSTLLCDGFQHCSDGSDEANATCGLFLINICMTFYWHQLWLSIAGDWKCRDGGFKCITGDITCINSTLLCDGFQHCSDASDEKSCGRYCKQWSHTN